MFKFSFILLLFLPLYADMKEFRLLPDSLHTKHFMQIEILDAKELSFEDMKGVEFSELSDLAYKDGRLFGVSDRGYLYKMKISFKNSSINSLLLLDAVRLKSKKEKILKKKKRDAEGLTFFHKNLLISFERKHRIDVYSLHGKKIKKLSIHKKLKNKDNYLKANKGLESVAYSDKYGVVTAPERPLKNEKIDIHTIYAKHTVWHFKYDASVTALEFRDKNRLLVLLRKFDYFTRRRVTTLLSLDLSSCENALCKLETLAIFDSFKGFHIDNFEGLTKVSKNRYLMISDDNGSFLQKTLLVLFELKD